MTRSLPIVAALALAACARPAPQQPAEASNSVTSAGATEPVVDSRVAPRDRPTPETGAAAWTQDRYLGRWTGVEGTFLDVKAKPGGGVAMTMQYDLDHRGTFDGSVTAEGLRFMRDGVAETAVPGDGDATGLKWLTGKKECLVVRQGEGYCRG